MFIVWKDGKSEVVHLVTLMGTSEEVIRSKVTDYDYASENFILPGWPKRIRGYYEFRSASAELNLRDCVPGVFKLELKFEKLEDGQKLYQMISAGKIWPKVNYEDEQVPSPLRHIRDLWRELWGIIRRETAARFYQLRSIAN